MALKGKIYSLAKQYSDLNTNQVFESMLDKSATQDTIVMDGRNLAAGSVFAEQIHAKAITADKIDSKAIKADHIDAGNIDVGTLWGDTLILQDKTYGGVVIDSGGFSMNAEGISVNLSSASGFNITDKNNNKLINIDPKSGNVIMQVNQMVIGQYNAATIKDIDDIEIGGRNLFNENNYGHWVLPPGGPSKGSMTKNYSAGYKNTMATRYVSDGTYRFRYQLHETLTEAGYYNVSFFYKTLSKTNFNVAINDRHVHHVSESGATSEWKKFDRSAYIDGHINVHGFIQFDTRSGTDVLISDVMVEKGTKPSDWSLPPEDEARKIYNPVRYIRDWSNGNDKNTANHWLEIEAYSKGRNVAYGRPASTNGNENNLNAVTNGSTTGTHASTGHGEHYIEVDLGRNYYDVESISIWRYNLDNRTYRSTKTEVSSNGSDWVTIFDSEIEGEYVEQLAGKNIPNTKSKAESLSTSRDALRSLGDETGKVSIHGGNIKAGTISSENNYSWIDLDKGNFGFGNGALSWDGGTLKIGSNNNLSPEIEATKKSIQDIEIGGRNLLRNTSKHEDTRMTEVEYNIATPLTNGTYVLTFEGKANRSASAAIYVNDNSGKARLRQKEHMFRTLTTNYSKYKVDLEIINSDGVSTNSITLRVRHVGTEISIKGLKLEKGNKPTDWTPAPEDINEIADKSQRIFDFDGAHGNDIRINERLGAYGQFSLSTRVFLRKVSGTHGFFYGGQNPEQHHFEVTSGGKLRARINDHNAATTNNVIKANQWHDIVIVAGAGGVIKMFLDGSLIHTSTSSFRPMVLENFAIGNSTTSGREWDGYIDFLTFYGRALTDEQAIAVSGKESLDYAGLHYRLRGNAHESIRDMHGQLGTNIKVVPSNTPAAVSHNIAANAKEKTDAWSFNGTTMIDGTSIQTGTIQANSIATGAITADKIVMGTGNPAAGNLAGGKNFTGTYIGTVPGDGKSTVGSGYASFGNGAKNNSAPEDGFIQLDLGSNHQISESRLFFFAGDYRRYMYKVKYSTDGNNWYYAVGNQNTNGWTMSRTPKNPNTGSYEPTIDRFAVPIVARYIRVYGNGNTTNNGNHIYQWELYSKVQTTISGSEIVTDSISSITANLGEVTAGIIRDKDNDININLNTGVINLKKPLTINNVNVATRNDMNSAINNIEVGGRNFLKGTTSNWTQLVRPAGDWFFQRGSDYKLEVGETYTFSVVVEKVSNDSVPINLHLGLGSAANGYSYDVGSWRLNAIPFGRKISLTHTVTQSDAGTGNRLFFAWRLRNERLATTIRFKDVKLEKGNKATDWTPAPEDIDSAIDAADKKADSASSTASTALDRVTIKDTRTTNQSPSWYYQNHPSQTVTETKEPGVVGFTGTTLGTMTTVVPGSNTSSGAIKQTFRTGSESWRRSGTTSWTSWSNYDRDGREAKAGLEEVEGKINNAVTTIDGTGVTVKDGSFFLEDDTADTKYSLQVKRNMIDYHSFEAVMAFGGMYNDYTSSTTNYNEPNNTSISGSWHRVNDPRITSGGATHNNQKVGIFGKSMLVNNVNYVFLMLSASQAELYPMEQLTFSFHSKKPVMSVAGQPRVEIDIVDENNTVVTPILKKNYPASTEKIKRHSVTFNIPGAYDERSQLLRIRILSANGSEIVIDGVQLVDGPNPIQYDPATEVWNLREALGMNSYNTRGNIGNWGISPGLVHTHQITVPNNQDGRLINFMTSDGLTTNMWVEKATVRQKLDVYGDVNISQSVIGNLMTYKNTGKTYSSINATNNSSDRWNSEANSSLKLRNSNNALSFIVGGTSNNRHSVIQGGHDSPSFASHLSGLHLNRLGGTVYVGSGLSVSGTKNAIHITRDGLRATPAYEMAESYLGDMGEDKTGLNSKIKIMIDTLFFDTVNTDYTYHVFLQAHSNNNVWVEEREKEYFIIASDSPGVSFSWEMKAKRRGFEKDRLVRDDAITYEDMQTMQEYTGIPDENEEVKA